MTSEQSRSYKITEIVGTSPLGLDDAIRNGIADVGEINLDWFEVREIRGRIEEGSVSWFQVKMGVGFRA